jgi:hypothetical protein
MFVQLFSVRCKIPLAHFDQTAYQFRHNGNIRPGPETSRRVFYWKIQTMNQTKSGAAPLPENADETLENADDPAEAHNAPAKRGVKTGLVPFEDGLMPVDYLLGVMRDTTASNTRRDKAATSVLPYVHPRVSPIAPVVEQDTAAQRRMKEASDSLIQAMADFKAEEEGQVSEPTDGSAA